MGPIWLPLKFEENIGFEPVKHLRSDNASIKFNGKAPTCFGSAAQSTGITQLLEVMHVPECFTVWRLNQKKADLETGASLEKAAKYRSSSIFSFEAKNQNSNDLLCPGSIGTCQKDTDSLFDLPWAKFQVAMVLFTGFDIQKK